MAVPVVVRIIKIDGVTTPHPEADTLYIQGIVRFAIVETTVTRAEILAVPQAQRQGYIAQKLALARWREEQKPWASLYGEITIEFTPP